MMDATEIQARADRSPFTAILRLKVRALDAQSLTLRMPLHADLHRSTGVEQFHGGAIATLIDVAGVYAVAAITGVVSPTVHLTVDYLKVGTGEWLDATATVRRKGRSLSTVDVEVLRPDGELVALGRAVYIELT